MKKDLKTIFYALFLVGICQMLLSVTGILISPIVSIFVIGILVGIFLVFFEDKLPPKL